MRDALVGPRVAAVVAATATALPSAVVAGVGPVPAALALVGCALGVLAPRSPAALVGPALLVVVLATGAAADVPLLAAAVLVAAGTTTLWCTHVLLTALAAAGSPDAAVPDVGLALLRALPRRLWPPLVGVAPAVVVAAALEAASRDVADAGWPAAALLAGVAGLAVWLVGRRGAGAGRR